MERVVKSKTQLAGFHSNNPRGCPRNYVTETGKPATLNPFKHGRPENRPLEAPSFLVPAVIEALRCSKRYKSKVRVVPGEADGYCAQAAVEHGGIVVTSDSDLLVHDLGDGGVALLRDIYQDDEGVVRAAIYQPREIFQALGLSGSADICRFAYERWISVHATTAMLIRSCSEPVEDETRYQEFCIQYRDEERVDIPKLPSGQSLPLDGIDPRWSELILQLSQPKLEDGAESIFKMFLPVLIDSPEKGTAWENSRYIRQLAYSIARGMLAGAGGAIHEYRRVQSLDQNGRQVVLLSPSSIHVEAGELALTMQRLERVLAGKPQSLYWFLAYIVLDIQGSTADARSSFALEMLQQKRWPGETAPTIPWNFAHLVAHLQAAYYSLRMLQQLFKASPTDVGNVVGPHYTTLAEVLEKLPLLEDSPNAGAISRQLNLTPAGVIDTALAKFIKLPKSQSQGKAAHKRNKTSKPEGISKKPARPSAAGNMFGLLSLD